MKNYENILENLTKAINKYENMYGHLLDINTYLLDNKVELLASLAYIEIKIENDVLDLEKEVNRLSKIRFGTREKVRQLDLLKNVYKEMLVYKIYILKQYGIDYLKINSGLLHNILTYIYKHKKDEAIYVRRVLSISDDSQKMLKNLLPEDLYNKIIF